MKNKITILTYRKNSNYGVVYENIKRVFIVVDENGTGVKNGEFGIGIEAVDFAHDEYEKMEMIK